MSRAEAAGDQRVIAGKIAARYSSEGEQEVIYWFKELLDFEVHPGMMGVMESLKNGQALVRLAMKIRDGTPDCPPKAKKMLLKPNTMSAPFKQMENIQSFLTFALNYGVHKNSAFPTADLYEGRNMAQVLSCIQLLGSECQRLKFNGPTIGPKPTEQNIRTFTDEQMAEGKKIIGLQAGTNKCASQKGMSSGGARHCADIKTTAMDKRGVSELGGQMGYNKGASQSGMAIGAVRHVSDIKAGEMDKAGQSVLSGQTGYNKGASQAGMAMGSVRHVSDIKADDMDREGQSILGGQMGYTKGASQAGMSMGAVRHVSDIKSEEMDRTGQGVLSGQTGYNKGASQSGMSTGVRHAADIKSDDMVGGSVLGLQMGSNKGASQSGMAMGSMRHVSDMKTGEATREGSGVIGLQMGQTGGASQQGMSYGGRRDITKK